MELKLTEEQKQGLIDLLSARITELSEEEAPTEQLDKLAGEQIEFFQKLIQQLESGS